MSMDPKVIDERLLIVHGVTIEEWLEDWAEAVADGQSSISRAEAVRRYRQRYERDGFENDNHSGVKSMSQPMRELPRYKGHKIVHALKIHAIDLDLATGAAVITPADEGYGPFGVNAEYMGKHKPRIGGYYVVYDDGYRSWSPADAFEKGYTKIDGIHSPLAELSAALQKCNDYAWAWQCNLACMAIDANASHESANRSAAQFMKNVFGVDICKLPQWTDMESQWKSDKSQAELQ